MEHLTFLAEKRETLSKLQRSLSGSEGDDSFDDRSHCVLFLVRLSQCDGRLVLFSGFPRLES